MTSVEKKRKSVPIYWKGFQISCRRKKKGNKLLLQQRTESDGPSTEKSLVYFHTYSVGRGPRGIHASYLFSFEDKAEEEEEEDYRYRILHGPYGLGRSVLPPIFGPQALPSDAKFLGHLATLGTKIYHIGGSKSRFSEKVYSFDTCNPGGGWTEVAPPIIDGYYSVAVVDNKIYVMSMPFGKCAAEPWGQVFDPVLNKWSPMPEPPSPDASYLAHIDDVEKIILVSTDVLYGYNVRTNSWFVLDKNFKEKKDIFADCAEPPVVVNRCVYWLGDDELFGYDLDERELYIGKFGYLDLELRGIIRHPGDLTSSEYAMKDNLQLMALGGGKLCLVWQHDKPVGPYTDPLIDPNPEDSTFDCVYCIKFEVSKAIKQSEQEGELERILNFSIESSKSFLLKDRLMELLYIGAIENKARATATASKEEICGVQQSKKARKFDLKKSNKPMLQRCSSNKPMLQRCSKLSSMEVSVCFQTVGPKCESNFYMFNFSNVEDRKAVDDHHYQIIHGPYGFGRTLLHPILSAYKKHRESSSAALGSTVYCFGGPQSEHSVVYHTRKVHCFDTRDPGFVMKKAPSMIKRRFSPRVYTLDGNIYVLGGLHESDKTGPWMEMFDPHLNKWIGLSSNPYINITQDSLFMSALLRDPKILLTFHKGQDYMHAYDFAKDSWYVGDKFDMENNYFFGPVEAVDRTLYEYDYNEGLVAYDLDERKWFRGQFLQSHLELRGLLSQPVDSRLECEVCPILHHISGGKFCLLWQHRTICGPYTEDPDSCFTCVYCIKFQASKLINFNGEGILNFTIESSKSFLIDEWMELWSALIMDTTAGGEENEIVS